jgi:hypothetical protein
VNPTLKERRNWWLNEPHIYKIIELRKEKNDTILAADATTDANTASAIRGQR